MNIPTPLYTSALFIAAVMMVIILNHILCLRYEAAKEAKRQFNRGYDMGWVDRQISHAAEERARRDRRGRFVALNQRNPVNVKQPQPGVLR